VLSVRGSHNARTPPRITTVHKCKTTRSWSHASATTTLLYYVSMQCTVKHSQWLTAWKKSRSISASDDHTTWSSFTSSNTTTVPFMKFFPMINSSSPPLVEQQLIDFFEISGAPIGWATHTLHLTYFSSSSDSSLSISQCTTMHTVWHNQHCFQCMFSKSDSHFKLHIKTAV